MRIPRLYTPADLRPGETTELDAPTSRRLLRVLRLRDGAPLVLFNGDGKDYPALLHVRGRDQARAEVQECRGNHSESPLHISLLQGVSRGERMDYTLQKAVELGVKAVYPLFCERSVVRLDSKRADKRLHHWQGVVISACEQSGRSRIPELHPLRSLDAALQDLPQGQRLLPQPGSPEGLAAMPTSAELVLLVGPEGGLSEAEVERARATQFRCIHLGPRILRTETAGVATLAALQALWGDLR